MELPPRLHARNEGGVEREGRGSVVTFVRSGVAALGSFQTLRASRLQTLRAVAVTAMVELAKAAIAMMVITTG